MSSNTLTLVPDIPEAAPISPALAESLRMYKDLKTRCNFHLGTICRVRTGQIFDEADVVNGSIATDDLLTKYPTQLTPDQRQALEIGMPKVYWAFEQVGFPDLDLRESTGLMKSFTSFATIRFDEFTGGGRNFGTPISLLTDTKESILEALQRRLDDSVLDITAKTRRGKNREFVDQVQAKATYSAALRIEEERENIRRTMRGEKKKEETS